MKAFMQKALSSFSFQKGSKEIIRLCRPFLDQMEFINFYYVRINRKGELIYLTNQVGYAMDYWEAGLPLCTGFNDVPGEVQSTVLLWANKLNREILSFAEAQKCYDGSSFINRYYDQVQFTSFQRKTPVENPSQFYLENLVKLRCWLRDFEMKNISLIGQAEKKPMFLPDEYLAPQKHSFYYKKNLELHFNQIHATVSFREMDCLYFYTKGFTCPHIAKLLGVSPRTIETHLEAVKNAFGLSSRDGLAALSYGNPILQSYTPRFK
ncbi:MAG: hypothetical protein H0X29_04405 [Parachlamydiaceae bacterium]|nr:hypothetical protein [Parachlamydiaceae bacterium]